VTERYETVGAIRRACTRGCLTPRRHVADCVDRESCDGCFPRPAEYGLLCYPCHKRFEELVKAIPGQHRLLMIAAIPSGELNISQETIAKIGDGWRTDSDQRHQGPYAHGSTAAAESSEPMRTAALDAAQMVSDWLSETIERLVEDYRCAGPVRLMTLHEQAGNGRVVWKSAEAGYRPLVVHGSGPDAMAGEYVWTEPPPRFEIHAGTTWLMAQMERLEYDDAIGDVVEQFSDLMSQAHALAPWREQVAKLPGIPCRTCHRCTLARFGGQEFVTCLNQKCRETYSPGEYAIWTRVLADARDSGAEVG
jgi:hypothetical protein